MSDENIEADPTLSPDLKLSEPLEPVFSGPLSSLDAEQRTRVAALNMAKPLLAEKTLLGGNRPAELSDLIRLAEWILTGEEEPLYPFVSGEVIVLGPELFVGVDGDIISWRGSTFTRQEGDGDIAD